jgi:hypothetical protein
MPNKLNQNRGKQKADKAQSKRVEVFVCGVQKGGTTSLDAYFREHPQLSGGRRKELHFFDKETRNWANTAYRKLHESFPADDADRLRFDVTPIYCYWPGAMERIAAYNPEAKLIFLFRDPLDRAWSQYCMEFARKKETLPFAEAIRDGRERLKDETPKAAKPRIYSYIERGFYGEQVERALKLFPRENMLFLKSDEFANDYMSTLAKVSSFLVIDPFADTGVKRKNKRPKTVEVVEPTADDRALAAGIYREDLKKFSSLTGLDISEWPST